MERMRKSGEREKKKSAQKTSSHRESKEILQEECERWKDEGKFPERKCGNFILQSMERKQCRRGEDLKCEENAPKT